MGVRFPRGPPLVLVRIKTYLPLLQIVLLGLVLLDQIFEDLLQPVGVGLERGLHILDGALYQDAVDHAEAFAIVRERLQSLKDEPGGLWIAATRSRAPPSVVSQNALFFFFSLPLLLPMMRALSG